MKTHHLSFLRSMNYKQKYQQILHAFAIFSLHEWRCNKQKRISHSLESAMVFEKKEKNILMIKSYFQLPIWILLVISFEWICLYFLFRMWEKSSHWFASACNIQLRAMTFLSQCCGCYSVVTYEFLCRTLEWML